MAHPDDWGLTDPKMVGASEYAAIHETLADALAVFDDGEEASNHALDMLDEFITYAQSMKTEIGGAPTPYNTVAVYKAHAETCEKVTGFTEEEEVIVCMVDGATGECVRHSMDYDGPTIKVSCEGCGVVLWEKPRG